MPYRNRKDQLASQRRWYARNAQTKVDWQHRRRLEMKEWLATKKPMCAECGERRGPCLLFHHIDDDKEVDISHAVHSGWSKTRIEAEIAKCIVLCGNCHMKLHWNERLRKRRYFE